MKRKPKNGEKIFTSYSSDRGLMYRIYKELKKNQTPKEQIIPSLNG
jgi:hypothetical protein